MLNVIKSLTYPNLLEKKIAIYESNKKVKTKKMHNIYRICHGLESN